MPPNFAQEPWPQPPPQTAERRNLLAPESVTRLSTHVQELRADMWEITMGDAVPAFVHANGPAKVVTYNFLLEKGAKVQSQLVTRRPVDRSGSEFQDKHDLADLFDLTPLGKSCLKAQPNKQVRAGPRHVMARHAVCCQSQHPHPPNLARFMPSRSVALAKRMDAAAAVRMTRQTVYGAVEGMASALWDVLSRSGRAIAAPSASRPPPPWSLSAGQKCS